MSDESGKTPHEEWAIFEKVIFKGHNPTPLERAWARNVFYAGFASGSYMVSNALVNTSPEEARQVMKKISNHLEEQHADWTNAGAIADRLSN